MHTEKERKKEREEKKNKNWQAFYDKVTDKTTIESHNDRHAS